MANQKPLLQYEKSSFCLSFLLTVFVEVTVYGLKSEGEKTSFFCFILNFLFYLFPDFTFGSFFSCLGRGR